MEPDSDYPPPKALSLFLLLFASPQQEVFTGVLAIVGLLILLTIFSAVEVAFFSLTLKDIAQLSEDKSRDSRRILALREKPRYLLSTLIIVSNLMIISIVLVSNALVHHFFANNIFQLLASSNARALAVSQQSVTFHWSDALNFSITAAIVASAVIIFNESAPRWYVPRNKIQFLKALAAPLQLLVKVFHPLNVLLLNSTKIMELRWGRSTQQKRLTTQDNVEESAELPKNSGNDKSTTEPEMDILKSILKFSDVTVRQIMTPRMDVVALDQKSTYSEVLEMVRESGYSRIPVYEDDFDNIIGILYVKDLLGHIQEGSEFDWSKLVRTNVLYVPEAKKINELLREFQKQRMHLAIVVDEYGGSAGIVTLEDVLEEIIGDIKDEFDDETEVQYRQLNENTYLFEGKTLLQDVYRLTGIEAGTFDEARSEADSLAGLILAMHGQIPKKDIELAYKNYHFKIMAVNKRRIEQVQLTIEPEETT